MALYRDVAEPVASALQKFAPEMALSLDQASVDVGAGFELRDLRARARTDSKGVDARARRARAPGGSACPPRRASNTPTFRRAAPIALDELALDPDRAARDAAREAAHRRQDRARVRVRRQPRHAACRRRRAGCCFPPASRRSSRPSSTGVDLAQALALARRKGAPLDAIESAEGKAVGEGARRRSARRGCCTVEIVKSDAAVKLAQLPWKLSAHAAQVTAYAGARCCVAGAHGFVGESELLRRRGADRLAASRRACRRLPAAPRCGSSNGFPG